MYIADHVNPLQESHIYVTDNRVSDKGAIVKNENYDPVDADGAALVPLSVGGHTVYLTARELGPARRQRRSEREIADRGPRLEKVIGGVAEFAKEVVGMLQETDASKVSVEFGCEFALESGSFIAVIGKVTSRSALKVGLEWAKPTP